MQATRSFSLKLKRKRISYTTHTSNEHYTPSSELNSHHFQFGKESQIMKASSSSKSKTKLNSMLPQHHLHAAQYEADEKSMTWHFQTHDRANIYHGVQLSSSERDIDASSHTSDNKHKNTAKIVKNRNQRTPRPTSATPDQTLLVNSGKRTSLLRHIERRIYPILCFTKQ